MAPFSFSFPAGLARRKEKKPAKYRTFKETQARSYNVQYSPEISVNLQLAKYRPTETTSSSTRACPSSCPTFEQVPKGPPRPPPRQGPEISSCQVSLEISDHVQVSRHKISGRCRSGKRRCFGKHGGRLRGQGEANDRLPSVR